MGGKTGGTPTRLRTEGKSGAWGGVTEEEETRDRGQDKSKHAPAHDQLWPNAKAFGH